MTAVMPAAGPVRVLTLDEVRAELVRLTLEVERRSCSLAEFKERGERWELDSDDRALLTEILSLEYFLARDPR
ncbi:hypothetical protein AB0C34_11540 [Nocardia sp. NPDC049220]|uniref:hypothetical protein n=1 Tax=Nocardia sp. NPDC049220 TaxID=3155273 RepID=UPI0033F469A0